MQNRAMIKSGPLVDIVFFFVISLQSFFTVLCAQDPPRSYIAPKSTEVINIDGKGDETAWKNTRWTDDFIDIEGNKTPKYRTRMKMIWDDSYLYFYVEMEEPHVWGTLKKRDTVIFYNNDFEIFIDPDGDTHNYMEFEMNVLNTVWDLWLTKPYRNHAKVIDGWDIHGLKTAVQVDGTINNSANLDKGWRVEIAMPWEALLEACKNKEIPANSFWRINFSRVNWDFDLVDGRYSRKKEESGKFLPEYNWVWSPQWVINMHEPEHWGYVYFSEDSSEEFEIPKDEYLKGYLFEMAREVWKGEKDEHSYKHADLPDIIKKKKIFGQLVEPTFESHTSGWNIWIRSPFSGKILVVKEDGGFTNTEQ